MFFRTLMLAVFLTPALAAAQSSPVLNKIIQDVQAAYNKQERPIVVFDTDGTLLDNRPRTLFILSEFAKQKAYVTPEAAQRLANITLPMVQYRLPDTLNAIGITDPAVVNNAAAFWGERFFASEYLKNDVATPGSVDFLRRLYSSGARIIYVSGRDLPRQFLGTTRSLYELGFPMGIQGTELAMKPTTQTQDAIFKQQVTTYLRVSGKVVATFDNEPVNANVYRRAFADATVVLYQAPHTPNPPPLLPNITSIASFQ